MTKQEFINEIARYVKEIAPIYGISIYSPIIAQSCLESAYGTSFKAQFHNYFGLKYRENRVPIANSYIVDNSKEQNIDGSYINIFDKWFKFNSMRDGVEGYFQFINTSNYQNLKGVNDARTYLENIKKDGYATSLNYVDNLMNVIKTNDLTKFDNKKEVINMSNFKVHLDPGHYGSNYNTSPVNKNYKESNFTFKLAQYLKEELEKRGIVVTLSRNNKNADPSLYDRGYGAKGCNLFLSLHSNACRTESVDYPIVYRGYDKTNANEFAQKLSNLIKDLMKTKQDGKVGTRKGNNGEYYGVLRGARAAGLTYYYIIEHSFHTNLNATNWLLNDDNVKLLASKESDLICSYFGVKTDNKPIENKPTTNTNVTNNNVNKELYRVRKSWNDANSQIGAYSLLENAKNNCKSGYYVFNSNGEVVYPISKPNTSTFKSYKVKINTNVLNVRSGAGTSYKVNTTVKKNEVYTIVDEKNGWGKLKSGAGWISLAYTKKV